ncbi:uncharacterized protein G2W53_023269 [Senna tora]|uniref:Uncharacterized protein n=1 Tax=Senna tora TaxID=362788 RepID=A0A834TI30_9FABA|nr:uncharacterized protein G2W53_023269 [Senna tora]
MEKIGIRGRRVRRGEEDWELEGQKRQRLLGLRRELPSHRIGAEQEKEGI